MIKKEYMVRSEAVIRYNEIYKGDTRDHHYPNENIVRLTKWFFKAKYGSEINKKKCLDYGCGSSENMQHLIRSGFNVSGIEISDDAIKLCEKKLSLHPDFKGRYDLCLLKPADDSLPYSESHFDCVLSNQVVYFLGDIDKIRKLLKEFHRVCKYDGKLIITMVSRFNSICIDGRPIAKNVYRWRDFDVYVFHDEQEIRDVFCEFFNIIEIGHFDNYYCGTAGHHWVILAKNLKYRS